MTYDDDDDDVFKAKAKPVDTDFSFKNPTEEKTPSSGTPDSPVQIPSYLQDALHRYVRENPNALRLSGNGGNRTVPYVVEIFNAFLDAACHSITTVEISAAQRAVFDVLDEYTDGAVSARTEIYIIEQKITNLHDSLRFCNDIYMRLDSFTDQEPTPKFITFKSYLATYTEILDFSVQDLMESYKTICKENGFAGSATLEEFGKTEYANLANLIYNPRVSSLSTHKHGRIKEEDSFVKVMLDLAYMALLKNLFEPDPDVGTTGVMYI